MDLVIGSVPCDEATASQSSRKALLLGNYKNYNQIRALRLVLKSIDKLRAHPFHRVGSTPFNQAALCRIALLCFSADNKGVAHHAIYFNRTLSLLREANPVERQVRCLASRFNCATNWHRSFVLVSPGLLPAGLRRAHAVLRQGAHLRSALGKKKSAEARLASQVPCLMLDLRLDAS